MSQMPQASAEKKPKHEAPGAAFVLVATLIAIYSISQFFRNAIGVIGPDLAREFDLDARGLSLLASVFFLSFAALQIPLGMIIDRFGPKIAIVATAMIAVVGTILFAMAESFTSLLIARLLIGAGCSSFFMGSLAIYSERFPPQRFSTMVGIQLGVGTIGAIFATTPLAWSTAHYGWRASFMAIGLLTFLLTLLVMLLVRDSAAGNARRADQRENFRTLLKGVVAATRVKSFWPVFLMQATTYSGIAAIIGLWGGPWLTHVYGLDLAGRGWVLGLMVTAQIIGLFICGPSDRWFSSYRIPGLIGGVLCLAVASFGAVVALPAWAAMPYLLLYGLAFSTTPVLTAHGRALFPQHLLGRGLTLMNMGNMGGVFIQQALTGLVLERFGSQIIDGARVYPAAGYRAVFGLIAAELAIALVFYARTIDPHPNKSAD